MSIPLHAPDQKIPYNAISLSDEQAVAVLSGAQTLITDSRVIPLGLLYIHSAKQQAILGTCYVQQRQAGADGIVTVPVTGCNWLRASKNFPQGVPWPYQVHGYGQFLLHDIPISSETVGKLEAFLKHHGIDREWVKERLKLATANAPNGPVVHFRDMTLGQRKKLLRKLLDKVEADKKAMPAAPSAPIPFEQVPQGPEKGWLKPSTRAYSVFVEVITALYGVECLSKLLKKYQRIPVSTALALDVPVQKHEIALR